MRPSLLQTKDVKDAIAIRDTSDLVHPLSGAMGRILGYRCPYEAGIGKWDARGSVVLKAFVSVDGVEKPGSLFLAGFGCGARVSEQRVARIAAGIVADWQVKATQALAGVRFTTSGTTFGISRFVVEVAPPLR